MGCENARGAGARLGGRMRTWRAPATHPITAAFWSASFLSPLPARNCPPPLENWMIMGALAFLAASRHALMIGDIVQFTAGMA